MSSGSCPSMAPARLLLTLSLLVIFGFTQFTLGVEHHVCKEAEIELAIVLDASSSIRPKDFKSSLRFLQDYLRQFDVGAERHMRVALVTFAKEAHPENGFNLTTYENEEEMIAAIGKIRYLKERYTNTGHALQYMRQVILPRDSTRPTANRVALVITDGNSQKPKRTAAEAKAARDDGIALFVIGIGKKIRERELLDIGGDPTRVARLETFHQLHAFIKTLAVMTCIKAHKLPSHILCGNTPLEMVILLDASSLVSSSDFEGSIKFVQDYLQTLDIGYSSNSVRVSVVPYSSTVHTKEAIQLSSYDTVEEISDAVGRIEQKEAAEKYIWNALEYTRTVVLNSYVVRPGVSKILLVITDGKASDPEKTAAEAKLALEHGILVHVVGVGKKINDNQLAGIAGDKSRVTRVDDYDELHDNIRNLAFEYCLDKKKIDSIYNNEQKLTTWIYISDCVQPTPLDVYFVYSQSALGPKLSAWVTEFILATLSVRKLSFEHRYGVISDSCESFDLDDFRNADDIRQMLTNQNNIDRMESALNRLTEGFKRDRGSRSDALKVAVVVVDGKKSKKSIEVHVAELIQTKVQVFITDPSNSGVEFSGATTLKGNAQYQSAYLVKALCSN